MTDAPPHSTPCLLVTAFAGHGKSAFLAARCPPGGLVAPASALLAGGVPDQATWVGIDDAQDVPTDDLVRLLWVLRSRGGVGLAVASREPLSAEVRAALPGPVSERDASDLALTPYAVSRRLATGCGVTDTGVALRVAELTAGWPVLVDLAADALTRDPHADLERALSARGTAAVDWIHTAVLDTLHRDAMRILGVLAAIDTSAPVTQDLCDVVAASTGCRPLPGIVECLRAGGVLVPRRRVGTHTELVLVPALASVLATVAGVADRGPSVVATAAARTHEAAGAWLPAARAYVVAGHAGGVETLLVTHGEDMLRSGGAVAVPELVDRVMGTSIGAALGVLSRTRADALRMAGDRNGARRAFAALVAESGASGWSPGLAGRVAALHYLCGEFETALAVLDRCQDVEGVGASGAAGEDIVDWWAIRVHVLAVLGRPDDSRAAAASCLTLAESLGEPRPLGVAHLAVARTCRGAAKDLHHELAIGFSTEAGDAVTLTRALSARVYLLLTSACYDAACTPAREAVRMARLACPPGLQAAALHNLGDALAHTGELEEALWHLGCSVDICRTLGPARAALALVGMADAHRALGHVEQSRAAYVEAVELARGSGDVQVLVPALCGLALLTPAGASAAAGQAVGEALQIAPPDLVSLPLAVSGQLAASCGDRVAASELAGRAVAAAREARASYRLAEALELEAAVAADPTRARSALAEALSIWTTGGAAPASARVAVQIGRLPDANGAERSQAREAARTLDRLGIRLPHVMVPEGGPRAGPGSGGVHVFVLGPFAVTVDGADVPLPAWRSRQARTLVKILAAQRGRVVTRGRLCDLLWPEVDPARTGHRLSVLLATVRGVLDPSKAWPADRYVVADQHGVRLDLRAVVLDADLLLRDAAHACSLIEVGDTDGAREVLAHIDDLYRGEAFEDECEEWVDALREQVRAAWVRSVRRLATLQSHGGRGGEALGILVRLLAVDPYDEQVHRRLVTSLARAGRHGEARRAFDRWSRAMSEIDAPAPDPQAVGLQAFGLQAGRGLGADVHHRAGRSEVVLTPR